MIRRLERAVRSALLSALVACATAGSAVAQTDAVTTPPPNVVLPNYLGVPAGPYGGLESDAYVARASDPSAAWFNPAGLSRAAGAEISGSAGLYQFTTVSPQAREQGGGSTQQLPNFVGFSVKSGDRLTLGLAFVTTHSWLQESDSELVTPSASRPERFAYSADSELSRRVAVASVAYHSGGSWRVGGGLGFSMTSLRLVETTSDRIADASTLRTLLVSARASGSTLQARPLVGAQLDAGPRWRIGLLVRAPGFTVLRNGGLTIDGTLDSDDQSLGASFFDPGARFDQRLPLELQGGIAYTGERLQLEVDVHGYTAVEAYPMLSSPEPMLVYADGPTGAPTVTSLPFAGLMTASRGFANVAVGGHYVLSPTGTLRVHFGGASDRSPVTEADQVFGKADLTSWTLGLSGSVGRLQFAAGANFRSGTARNIVVRNLLDGRKVETEFSIRTVGLIYSLAYQF